MSSVPSTSVTVIKNGPYKVENLPKLTLSDDSAGEVKATLFLCRCGQSSKKPFCDGTHSKGDWQE